MPIYAYACEACGHQMDKIQKFSDEPLVTCPVCEKDSLKKQITAPSFKLKGTGWYETDFKNNGKQSSSKTDGTANKTTSVKESSPASSTDKAAKPSKEASKTTSTTP